MKLWLVDGKGWGINHTIVRAATREDAIRVARESFDADVTELPSEGVEGILWNYEYSPDSRD